MALALEPPLVALTRRRWAGQHNIPKTGGAIVAVNHISYVDPLVVMHFVYRAGRWPHFLCKVELFRIPLFGRALRALGQIPVHRRTANAADALGHARAALERGECVVIYPEGTVTHNPAYWPMTGRTGVVRLALATGVPVIPAAQWGAQDILGRNTGLRLLPPRTVSVVAGTPIDLSPYAGRLEDVEAVRRATDEVMAEIGRLLAQLRGERPPESSLGSLPAAPPQPAESERRPL